MREHRGLPLQGLAFLPLALLPCADLSGEVRRHQVGPVRGELDNHIRVAIEGRVTPLLKGPIHHCPGRLAGAAGHWTCRIAAEDLDDVRGGSSRCRRGSLACRAEGHGHVPGAVLVAEEQRGDAAVLLEAQPVAERQLRAGAGHVVHGLRQPVDAHLLRARDRQSPRLGSLLLVERRVGQKTSLLQQRRLGVDAAELRNFPEPVALSAIFIPNSAAHVAAAGRRPHAVRCERAPRCTTNEGAASYRLSTAAITVT
mmetsp:Transcript_55973/g.160802  ORF Transcript_55973/g.160802 Transcript_55973/m.160802 type:complete len:255 (+) Transcript_55973:273-1037(+)